MGERPLTDLGLTMLGSLPPKVRNSVDYQAVIHAASREVALLEAAIETVRAQFNPATADVLLDAWEYTLKLPVGGPAGATTGDRRNLVLARLRKLVSTGEGSQWEQAITGIVGAGWSYIEQLGSPLVNEVPNPGFEYDTVGSAPAGYGNFVNCAPVVASAWADLGSQSLHAPVTFAAGVVAGAWAQILGATPAISAMPAGAIPVIAGRKVAARRRTRINSIVTDSGNFWQANWYFSWYDSSGNLLTSDTAGLNLAAGDVGTVKDVQALLSAPSNAAYALIRAGWSVSGSGLASQSLDVYEDSLAVYVDPAGGVIPAYADGDRPGFEWTGTPGDSPSQQLVTGDDGVVEVTLPYPPGSADFLNAQSQIRDITDAHIELVFASSTIFRLDTDPMDSTEFGA